MKEVDKMKILQRISAILAFCSILTFTSFTNAQTVQICDTGAHELYDLSYVFLNILTPLSCSDVKHLGKLSPKSPYDLYTFEVKSRKRLGKWSVVSFFNNGAGCVSKITIMSPLPDASDEHGYIIGSILVAIGLFPNEIENLAKKTPYLSNNSIYRDVWSARLNRRVIMEFKVAKIEKGARMAVIHLTATDN